jgi:hypothetical protein
MRWWFAIAVLAVCACTSLGDPSGDPPPGDDDPHYTGGDSVVGGDSVTTGDTDDRHCPATIADIKTGVVAVGASACLKAVMVTAVASGGAFVGTPNAETNGGLYLAAPVPASVSVGDTVNVGVAPVQLVSGELSLHAPTLAVTDSGDQPSPQVVAASDLASDSTTAAAYEAMLIFVPTVTVVDASADSFTVSDDGGVHVISVGGFLSHSVLNVNSGDMFDSITGIWRATSSGYQLEPRGEFDLEGSF